MYEFQNCITNQSNSILVRSTCITLTCRKTQYITQITLLPKHVVSQTSASSACLNAEQTTAVITSLIKITGLVSGVWVGYLRGWYRRHVGVDLGALGMWVRM